MSEVDGLVRELLYTDFDGHPVGDPDEVINAAFDDDRYTARVEPLRGLLATGTPYERFLACCALATWGELDGYRAVVDAAADPDASPWRGELVDRRYSVDETFAHLARAVGLGEDFTAAKGTEEERLGALRALVRIADTEYFDWQLAFALDRRTLPRVVDDVAAVVRRGTDRLAGDERPSFDLGVQLADLVAAAAQVDERLAVGLGGDLVRVDSSPKVLVHLAAVVSRGTGPVTLKFADYLASVGDDEVRKALADALARRNG
ncbi:hypothetical protein [Saccharothrix sp. Mg75]|uniref:hypothetical protein n=1 Tax=Saccharothrix sp. Mg75 TaxID=3445357 RepID=UPI003EED4969